MSIRKPFILLSMMFSSFLLLSACGGDDSGTASAPAPAAAPVAESMPAASSEGEALSINDIEKAEGVVYQDEIYAKWPK